MAESILGDATIENQRAFVPIYGDRGNFETFPDIEAAVREALPSAPRLLQIIIAGSALVNGDPAGDKKEIFWEVEGGSDGVQKAEDLIAARYNAPKAVPCKFLFSEAELAGSNPNTHFWRIVRPYVLALMNHQPAFIIEDIIGDEEMAARHITAPPLAEPSRVSGVHPKPQYRQEELYTMAEASLNARDIFWQTAEVSVWDNKAKGLDARMQQGVINLLSGPRGIGKSRQLLPMLASMAEQRGRVPIRLTKGPVELMEQVMAHKGEPITLLMDEPDNTLFSGTAAILKDLQQRPYDIETTIVFGAIDERERRVNAVQEAYISQFTKVGLAHHYEELSGDLPLITEISIDRWAMQIGADRGLQQFIKTQPYLRIPRVFDALLLGWYLYPQRNSDGSEPRPTPTIGVKLIYSYNQYLQEWRSPELPVYPARALTDLVRTLRAPTYRRVNTQDVKTNFLNWAAIETGANSDESYIYYQQLCEAVGIEPLSEDDLKDKSQMDVYGFGF